jgi:hypothetical protein
MGTVLTFRISTWQLVSFAAMACSVLAGVYLTTDRLNATVVSLNATVSTLSEKVSWTTNAGQRIGASSEVGD